ncbi:MAG: tRNA (adenosine(37)-N6)-threonylcarbamoyltransferase complex transferase subunit TsaD [Ignavibacteriae bacterium]|jgi:N6-L-threonylcarbamoyladenine synthase|nr:tRNA (adenosine(37)-N6)-threonylcarbamoyltransferase complex transferase subunit TsaD [Ignavibacteriota bacterium]
MLILAFETSCDETSVAVLNNGTILSNVILSQMFHSEFGGVVPEIASREHLSRIAQITEEALSAAKVKIKEIDIIAATAQPGLIGALLIGLNFAKSVAATLNKPFIPVNHIHAHLYSAFIHENKPSLPLLSLIVSGGHTLLVLVEDYFRHRILGTTIDDAAGEAFDKVAKMMGLGYPGGPEIDKLSKSGNKDFYTFPKAKIKEGKYDFSFSGLKTSVLYYLRKIDFENSKNDKLIADICASFQTAVIESLFSNTLKAAKEFGVNTIAISGGVSANSALKRRFASLREKGYNIFIPELKYTTDNAAMVGITAYYEYIHSGDKTTFDRQSFNAVAKPRLDYGNF